MKSAQGSWIIARGSPDLTGRFRTDLGAIPASDFRQPEAPTPCFLKSRPRSRSSDFDALIKLSGEFRDTSMLWLEPDSSEATSIFSSAKIIRNGGVIRDLSSADREIDLASITDLVMSLGISLRDLNLATLRPPLYAPEDWMNRALILARRQIGRVAPNPAVGCLIVKGQQLIGEGATGSGGRPHAEEIALADAGENADRGEVFVTLAPCGKRTANRGSCSQILAEAKIAKVHAACEDPHPLAAPGLAHLTAAGVETSLGLLREEAEAINCGFFKVVRTGRPWVAIDCDPSRYDGAFEPSPGEDHETALERLAREGATRLFIRPDTHLAGELTARGLVDEFARRGAISGDTR